MIFIATCFDVLKGCELAPTCGMRVRNLLGSATGIVSGAQLNFESKAAFSGMTIGTGVETTAINGWHRSPSMETRESRDLKGQFRMLGRGMDKVKKLAVSFLVSIDNNASSLISQSSAQ
jgi:hypothetical protein